MNTKIIKKIAWVLGIILISIVTIPTILLVGFLIISLCIFLVKQDLYGYIDQTGKFVISPKYYSASDFKAGKTSVLILSSSNDPCDPTWQYFINKKGQRISPIRQESGVCIHGIKHNRLRPDLYSEEHDIDLLPTRKLNDERIGKTGYRNRNGDLLIPPKFDDAGYFQNGIAWVKMNEWGEDRWGLINKKGEYILSPKCKSAGDFHEGLAYCRVSVYFGVFY